jgi:hypothetical protein
MQPVTFSFDDGRHVTISVEEVKLLLRKLRELEAVVGGLDFANPIAKIEGAWRVPADTLRPLALEPGEDLAVLRALQHLRYPNRLTTSTARLWDALLRQTGPLVYEYLVELDTAEGRATKTFVSYGGVYRVGDELPPDEDGVRWQVLTESEPDNQGRPTLFCMRSATQ